MSSKVQVVSTIALTFLLLVLISPSAYAQCGGLCLYEVGHPLQGASSAGAGAAAQDASTVLFNPAGMTRLQGNEVLLGTVLLFSDIRFNLNESQSQQRRTNWWICSWRKRLCGAQPHRPAQTRLCVQRLVRGQCQLR